MFERILLALDDSPAGEVATAFTGALAQRAGAETSVHVLHVNERLVGGRGVTLHTRAGGDRPGDRGGAPAGRRRRPRRRVGLRVVLPGVPERIVTVAAERAAGAIVLGSDPAPPVGPPALGPGP